jgi:hypothetical protein
VGKLARSERARRQRGCTTMVLITCDARTPGHADAGTYFVRLGIDSHEGDDFHVRNVHVPGILLLGAVFAANGESYTQNIGHTQLARHATTL